MSLTITVISDSHGHPGNISEVMARQEKVCKPGYVLFLGDGVADLDRCDLPDGCTLLAVQGNCDAVDSGYPAVRVVPLGIYRILMMHGHTCAVKHGLSSAVAMAVRENADLLLYGHTHQPDAQILRAGSEYCGLTFPKPLYIFNPGSIAEGSFGTITIGPDGILLAHGRLF